MRVRRGGAIVLTIGGLLLSGEPARAADPGAQIAHLQAIKRGLTPAERKLDSRLAVALHGRVKPGATTEVDIQAAPSAGLVARLQALGATVRYVSPRTGAIRAALPISTLRTVAGFKQVERV